MFENKIQVERSGTLTSKLLELGVKVVISSNKSEKAIRSLLRFQVNAERIDINVHTDPECYQEQIIHHIKQKRKLNNMVKLEDPDPVLLVAIFGGGVSDENHRKFIRDYWEVAKEDGLVFLAFIGNTDQIPENIQRFTSELEFSV